MSTPTWRSRIVDHGEVPPADLLANPKNWRIHPRHQQRALAGVLDRVGWVQDVIVNRSSGYVLDGHLRASLAISREEPTIPVSWVELTDAEEDVVLAGLDPLSGLAVADPDALNALLATDTDGELAALFSPEDRGQDEDGNDVALEWSDPVASEAEDEDPGDVYNLLCPDCGHEFPVVVHE
jgi:hypothetical protein